MSVQQSNQVLPSRLSKRFNKRIGSATAGVYHRLLELREQGKDIINLAVGEPDFEVSSHIRKAVCDALDAGATRYTAIAGTSALRVAIAEDSMRRRGVQHSEAETIVSVGAKHSLFNIFFVLLDHGDHVLIPTPCWVSYPSQCIIAGGIPVFLETTASDGYKITPERLRLALTPQTKAIVLCSPNNPTGSVYSSNELRALAEVLRHHSCWIVIDEIYSNFTYLSKESVSMLALAPDLKSRLIIVDGVSKRYAMTGFRIGWALAPLEVVKACEQIQSQTTTSPTTLAQYAALAALNGPQNSVETMRQSFRSRCALVINELETIPGISFIEPEGAFYVFLNIKERIGRRLGGITIRDDQHAAEVILERGGVALVPGSAFRAAGHLRISYTANEGTLLEATRRLRDLLV